MKRNTKLDETGFKSS